MNAALSYHPNLPIVGSYDVVVCGGGPVGCAAALSARRAGLSVLLVAGRSCQSTGQAAGTAVEPAFTELRHVFGVPS